MTRRTARWHAAVALATVGLLTGCSGHAAGGDDARTAGAPPTTITKALEATPEPAVGEPVPTAAPSDLLVTAGAVTEVVDGDTIKVDGQTVRLIGMDTPEIGRCGYDEATAAMGALVAGQVVTLTAVAGRDDTDKYGRLLRYVDVNGTDVGLREIDLGLGVARYDGRDGYGAHPRQDAYIAADAAAADITCPTPEPAAAAPAPVAPAPLVGSAGGGSCDPSYPTVCIPPAPPDLDCRDISFRKFTVLSPDPHNFDGNHDGVGCEGP
jgi:endonuclease YncB( thermonuclease family)